MVKTATYKVTDLLYVQIALQIFIYDLQEQFPREGMYEQRGTVP